MNIEVGTTFNLNAENGLTYQYKVINVNHLKAPNIKYACDVRIIERNQVFEDTIFIGDSWLNSFKDRIEFIV